VSQPPARHGGWDTGAYLALTGTLRAGTIGGLAMIPVGLMIRHGFGGAVNVYGELVVESVLGRVVPWALFAQHMLISWIFAIPVVLLLQGWTARAALVAGYAYGAGIWLVVNSLALPFLFGRPTPWQMGWRAIWPSLTVHIVYGAVTGLAAGRR
jgi:uncharacterized membrane protein YagU involved in acid resistance